MPPLLKQIQQIAKAIGSVVGTLLAVHQVLEVAAPNDVEAPACIETIKVLSRSLAVALERSGSGGAD